MNEKESVSVVNDQRGTPTWARPLAQAICTIILNADCGKGAPYGVYHFTGEADSAAGISWYDFACAIYEEGRRLGLLSKDCQVKPCTSGEFPSKVKRPAYSVLDKSKIKKTFGIKVPDWKESLVDYLEEKCAER
jgi:dTDP-4-dehydrorhamnose reductase